jgi:hypothetical protein
MRKNAQQPAQFTFGLVILDPQAHRIQSMHRPRRCLSCDGTFASTGPGNRICGPCKALDVWTSPNEFSVHASF